MKQPEGHRYGTLLIRLVPENPRIAKAPHRPNRLSLVIRELTIAGTNTSTLVHERPLDLNLTQRAGTTFLLTTPVGQYRSLKLVILRPQEDLDIGGNVDLDITVTEGSNTTIDLGFNVEELLSPELKSLDTVLRVLPRQEDDRIESRVGDVGPTVVNIPVNLAPRRSSSDTGATPISTISKTRANVTLHVPEGAMLPGTRIVVQVLKPNSPFDGAPAPAGLPALFRRQHAVGPAVEIVASQQPIGFVEITVPFDAAAAAATGVNINELVVLQLDDGRKLYRELRPKRVDQARSSLTVQTSTLSTFFACSPGIEISQPRLIRDAAEDASSWSSGPQATVAGRVADERAQTALFDGTNNAALPSDHSWQALGWFDFEGVPLRPHVTHILVRAEVDGLVAHECEFAVRSDPPPRIVTSPSRHYGPRLAITADDTPMVTAVIGSGRFSGDDLIAPLQDWQRSWNRYGPYIYRPTADGNGWEFRRLLPELHFEEATARIALGLLRNIINIPTPPNTPDERRDLATLAAYIDSQPDDPQTKVIVETYLNLGGAAFGLGTLSISPTVPLINLDNGNFGAAFVAATAEGLTRANTSRLRRAFGRLYSPLDLPERDLLPVNVGRLYYVSGSFEEDTRREVVADDVWCATIQLRRDPQSGGPVLAAIEPLDDAGELPQSRLVLFRRDGNGVWSREVISSGSPIADFDFDFLPFEGSGDGVTPVRFVAATAGRDFDFKTHLQEFAREQGAWLSQPLEYAAPWDATFVSDLGLWPRLMLDESGHSVIVFAFLSAGLITWLLAAVEGETLRVTEIGESGHEALTGSPLPPPATGLRLDSPVYTSRLSLAHWAASIASSERGRIWCAFGNGVLNLAEVDLQSRESIIQLIDVDRMIGFFPAIGTRHSGAPAIAYKDPWGDGDFGNNARDELLFFSLEQGNLVPPSQLPLAPPYRLGSFSLADLIPHQPLNCDALANPDFEPIIASVVLHRPFDIVVIPPDGDDPLTLTNINYAHRGFGAQLGRLRRRPTIVATTIDNSDFGEDIESVEIVTFADPIGTIPRAEIAQLDREVMTATVLRALMDTGTRLSRTFPLVVRRETGRAWDIVDPEAYSAGLEHIPQTYLIRDNGNELEIRLPPVLTVLDVARRHDENRRPTPCGLTIQQVDQFAQPIADQLDIFRIDLPDLPGRVRWLRARGIRVSRVAPHDPRNQQQGGVRFTIELPRFVLSNANPDAVAFSTEPSFVYVTVAPFVQNGRINWWAREVETRLGHVEVDVEFGFFDWLAILGAIIPGLGFLLLIADIVADNIATSSVNEELRPPETGNLQNLLLRVIRHITDVRGAGQPQPLEAIWLRGMTFVTYSRSRDGVEAERPERAILNVLPPRLLAFGSSIAGSPAVRRNILISSDGGAPSVLENIRIVGGADFRVASTLTLPLVLPTGNAEVVTLEFTPNAPPGLRSDQVEVTFNGGRVTTVALSGLVVPPPEPLLRIRPRQLQFGVVASGLPVRREIEVFNDGAAPLEIGMIELAAPGLPAGTLVLETVGPLSILPGSSAVILLRLAPPLGAPTSIQATCSLHTNDPTQPRVDIVVSATVSVGQLLVTPAAITFADTPIAANQPQLPPGLPPTIHRGPTRTAIVYNQGSSALTLLGPSLRALDAANAPSPHFALWLTDGSLLAPNDRTLRGGEIFEIVVEFAAAAPGDHVARIEVRATDPTQVPPTVMITGRAV